jgi:hypothetical protein
VGQRFDQNVRFVSEILQVSDRDLLIAREHIRAPASSRIRKNNDMTFRNAFTARHPRVDCGAEACVAREIG